MVDSLRCRRSNSATTESVDSDSWRKRPRFADGDCGELIERVSGAGMAGGLSVCRTGWDHQRMGAAVKLQRCDCGGEQLVGKGCLYRPGDHEQDVRKPLVRCRRGEQQGG